MDMILNRKTRHMGGGIAVLLALLVAAKPALAGQPPSTSLDAGFSDMYELQFPAARAVFHSYIREHPQDPMGHVALAASYLFEEFNKDGVLTSSFFLNDEKLLGGIPDAPEDASQAAFLQTDQRARDMANQLLRANPKDPNGLFVLTLANGLQADYDALVAKRHFASLMLLRQTRKSAHLLLSIQPDAADAYLALGAANYIIGCLPGYKKFFLAFGGIHGDRTAGMRQLTLAGAHGHYLAPFAKALLALAALREKQPALARALFTELHHEFPENGVFANELSKFDSEGQFTGAQ